VTTDLGCGTPTETESPPGPFRVYRELPTSAKILLVGMFINRLGAFLPFYLVLYMTSTGHSARDAAVALSAYGAGSIAGNALGGWVTDRIGHRRTIVVASAGAGIATIAIIYTADLYVLMVLVAGAGALSAAYRPATSALLATTVPPNRYTMVFAMYRMAMSLGTVGGPLVGAALVAIDFDALFWVEGVVLAAFALAAQGLLRRGQATREDVEESVARTGTIFSDHRFLLFLLSAFSLRFSQRIRAGGSR
jgi:MFS family permease